MSVLYFGGGGVVVGDESSISKSSMSDGESDIGDGGESERRARQTVNITRLY